MRKTYQLEGSNHKPARVVDSIRGDIRKYIKRERSKDLPGGTDFWDFDCRIGVSEEQATEAHVNELGKRLDAGISEGWATVYLEMITKARTRQKKGGS